eukprot:UN22737
MVNQCQDAKKWLQQHTILSRRYQSCWRQCFGTNFSTGHVSELKQVQDEYLTSLTHHSENPIKLINENKQAVYAVGNLISEEFLEELRKIRILSGRIEGLIQDDGIIDMVDEECSFEDFVEETDNQLQLLKSIINKGYANLNVEEQQLRMDLGLFNENMHNWDKKKKVSVLPVKRTNKHTNKKRSKISKIAVGDSRPVEIINIENLIDTKGKHGGWDEDDYNTFLTIYNQSNTKTVLLRRCKGVIRKSEKEIEGYLAWYEDRLDLIQQKKDLIQQYREKHKREKTQIKHDTNDDQKDESSDFLDDKHC